MKIDFDTVEEMSDYVTVPAGTYLCKIAEVQTGTTRNGDERWAFSLIVAEGEFIGRLAAWDSLVFSQRGMARVRDVFRALRLSTSGTVDVAPQELVERTVFVEVRPTEYRHPDSDQVIRRNEVPYRGYTAVTEADGSSTGSPATGGPSNGGPSNGGPSNGGPSNGGPSRPPTEDESMPF